MINLLIIFFGILLFIFSIWFAHKGFLKILEYGNFIFKPLRPLFDYYNSFTKGNFLILVEGLIAAVIGYAIYFGLMFLPWLICYYLFNFLQ
jgi:hypothetical protein